MVNKADQVTQEKGFFKDCLRDFKVSAIATIVYILVACLLSWIFGYKVSAEDMTYIIGIPTWVVIGVVIPWVIMVIVTGVYAFGFMKGGKL